MSTKTINSIEDFIFYLQRVMDEEPAILKEVGVNLILEMQELTRNGSLHYEVTDKWQHRKEVLAGEWPDSKSKYAGAVPAESTDDALLFTGALYKDIGIVEESPSAEGFMLNIDFKGEMQNYKRYLDTDPNMYDEIFSNGNNIYWQIMQKTGSALYGAEEYWSEGGLMFNSLVESVKNHLGGL